MAAEILDVIEGFGLEDFEVSHDLVKLIPREYSKRNLVVVLGPKIEGKPYKIGTVDAYNEALMARVAKLLHANVEPVQLTRYEVMKAIDLAYEIRREIPDHQCITLKPCLKLEYKKEKPVSDLLDDILAYALYCNASDIHIENYDDDLDLRFRIDGVLKGITCPITPENQKEFISRIKVISQLDVVETRKSQDGKIIALYQERNKATKEVSFRVSVIPGLYGEDVVIRILHSEFNLSDITSLGMGRSKTRAFENLLHNPEGLILVTGPTGSGKTTTLYTALNLLAESSKKILTVEDPVERVLENVNQKQVSKYMGFSDYTRAFLRQDPDVLLIGEVRDTDTANMAMRAAQNGSLVLSSLHTADAIRSLSRMYSLGVDWDLLVNGLLASINQRLLRKICDNCKEESVPSEELLKRLRIKQGNHVFYKGKGCEKCLGTGYRGRIAVYEMFLMNDDMMRILSTPEDILKLKAMLHEKGYRTIYHDALKKAARGETSLEEVIRCIPFKVIHN